jgi:hypothetical protein
VFAVALSATVKSRWMGSMEQGGMALSHRSPLDEAIAACIQTKVNARIARGDAPQMCTADTRMIADMVRGLLHRNLACMFGDVAEATVASVLDVQFYTLKEWSALQAKSTVPRLAVALEDMEPVHVTARTIVMCGISMVLAQGVVIQDYMLSAVRRIHLDRVEGVSITLAAMAPSLTIWMRSCNLHPVAAPRVVDTISLDHAVPVYSAAAALAMASTQQQQQENKESSSMGSFWQWLIEPVVGGGGGGGGGIGKDVDSDLPVPSERKKRKVNYIVNDE